MMRYVSIREDEYRRLVDMRRPLITSGARDIGKRLMPGDRMHKNHGEQK